ncbi:MAG: DUF4302 domain-containing protein [Dysgonomonas sp.]
MKTRIYIVGVGLLSLLLSFTGCSNSDDEIFGKSADERINEYFADCKDRLVKADNGWEMQYYVDSLSGGISLVVNFDEANNVTFTSKTTTGFTSSTSSYKMIADQGPVLSFDTYNEVLHAYSNPDPTYGEGTYGDFEFVIINQSDDVITLKGRKNKATIRLIKLPSGVSGEQYLTNLSTMDKTLFSGELPKLSLVSVDGSIAAYELSGGFNHIFSIKNSTGTDSISVPFIITTGGIRLYKAITLTGDTLQSFTLNSDKSALVSNENSNFKITGPSVTSFFNSEAKRNARWKINLTDNLSSDLQAILNRIKTSLKGDADRLTQISFGYSQSKYTVFIQTSQATANFYCDLVYDANTVTYTYTGTADTNGTIYYNNYDGFKDLITLLSSSYTLQSTISGLNLSNISFVNTTNSNTWFSVSK